MQTEAQKGNGFAMHDLGKMYLSGFGCEKDEEQAQAWFTKAYHAFIAKEASSKKKDYLQYRIGKLYAFGYGVEQDYGQAANGMKKQCRKTIPLLLMRSAVCTAAVRAWSKTMKKPMNCIAWQRSIRKSQTPMPHMSLDGCAGTGSARLQTRQHQKHGTGRHIRGSS